MCLETEERFLTVVKDAGKPLLFSEIARRSGLHFMTVSRLAYELASLGRIEIERIGICRRVSLRGATDDH